MAKLKLEIKEFEKNVGQFSRYVCLSGQGEEFAGQQIPFKYKPAQQFLSCLGSSEDREKPLSEFQASLRDHGNTDAIIRGFTPDSTHELIVMGSRVDELRRSAKLYVNRSVISSELFLKATSGDTQVSAQDKGLSPSGIPWQNLAVGICHVQKIDLLVKQQMNSRKEAITAEKSGIIKAGDSGIILLSTPALNFKTGTAREMSREAAEVLIKNMYHLQFSVTLLNQCTYLTLPAAGLGVFGGDPDLYFKCLFEVARLYPDLNIIYNPAQFVNSFKEYLKAYEKSDGDNVVITDRDVLFLADEMIQKGIPCAMQNPSDADVMYGVYDIGEYWKFGLGAQYVGEEHIGSISTAPFNSAKLNPFSYQHPIEIEPRAVIPARITASANVSGSTIALKFQKFKGEVLELTKKIHCADVFVFHEDAKRLYKKLPEVMITRYDALIKKLKMITGRFNDFEELFLTTQLTKDTYKKSSVDIIKDLTSILSEFDVFTKTVMAYDQAHSEFNVSKEEADNICAEFAKYLMKSGLFKFLEDGVVKNLELKSQPGEKNSVIIIHDIEISGHFRKFLEERKMPSKVTSTETFFSMITALPFFPHVAITRVNPAALQVISGVYLNSIISKVDKTIVFKIRDNEEADRFLHAIIDASAGDIVPTQPSPGKIHFTSEQYIKLQKVCPDLKSLETIPSHVPKF